MYIEYLGIDYWDIRYKWFYHVFILIVIKLSYDVTFKFYLHLS